MFRRLFGVQCFDFQKSRPFYRYKSEIPEHWIRVSIEGEGVYWCDPAALKRRDKPVHESLDEECLACIDQIMGNLKGVYDLSRDEWIEGFKLDANPDKEIAIWLHYSQKYKAMVDERMFSDEERESLFKMVTVIMNAGSEHALQNCTYVGEVEKDKENLVAFISR